MPYRPFTDFLNQGMRNTNRNAGNANMPQRQPNYSNPQAIYGFGNQGGGGLFDPGDWGGEGFASGEQGLTPPGGGIGGWYQQWGQNPNYEAPGSKPWEEPEDFITPSGLKGLLDQRFDIWEGPTAPPNQPHDPLPPGWEWQFVNGNWEPVESEVGALEAFPDVSAKTPKGVTRPGPADPIYQPGFEVQKPDPIFQPGFNEETNWLTPEFLDPIIQEQFAGGGGQGGQAAKKLYYPETSGGFASVGTGIGGGGSTLDELLRGLQG